MVTNSRCGAVACGVRIDRPASCLQMGIMGLMPPQLYLKSCDPINIKASQPSSQIESFIYPKLW